MMQQIKSDGSSSTSVEDPTKAGDKEDDVCEAEGVEFTYQGRSRLDDTNLAGADVDPTKGQHGSVDEDEGHDSSSW